MNRFQYQPRPAENWQGRAEQSGGNFIGFLADWVKVLQIIKDGNWLRILPPTWENPRHYGYDIWVHYSVGPQNAHVLCNLKMFNTPCSVCEAYTRAEAEGRDDAYDYKASRRVLVWLVNRKEEGDTPVAWAMPWTLDRDISKLCKDRQTGELYQIDNPDSGFDISFDREGELPNVKYVGVAIARRPSSVADKFLEFITQKPLPSILVKRTYEEVRSLFEGGQPTTPQTPVQQAPQQAPQQQVQQNPPEKLAPWDQPQTPQPVQQSQPTVERVFCTNTVSFQGQTLGCNNSVGHQPPCDFQRMLTQQPIAQQQPVQVTQPTQQPQQTTQQPTSRAAALRERFAAR